MILLLDFDSILYHSVYRIVSIEQMKDAIRNYGKESAKQWLLETVYNEGVERCEKEIEAIKLHLSNIFFEDITGVELFITTCRNSYRKQLAPSYKSNRKANKYVWLLREHYSNNGVFESDTREADDLIAARAKELGHGNCLVCSIDKDLKQIGGYYWSYYKQKVKDEEGNPVINEWGFEEREYKQKQVDFISQEEANRLFWIQMLTGDPGDNIKGLHRVGIKTAEKILNGNRVLWRTVAREYIARGQKQDFKINYQLLKLE